MLEVQTRLCAYQGGSKMRKQRRAGGSWLRPAQPADWMGLSMRQCTGQPSAAVQQRL